MIQQNDKVEIEKSKSKSINMIGLDNVSLGISRWYEHERISKIRSMFASGDIMFYLCNVI